MAKYYMALFDRWRTKRNGERRYVGQILLFDDVNKKKTKKVVAEVYGDTLEEMQARKQAVFLALPSIKSDPPVYENEGDAP